MRLRRTPLILGAITLILVGIFALILTGSMRHTVRLTAADIQSQLETKFPVERSELIFTWRFTDPVVAIDSGTERVRLGVSVAVSSLGKEVVTSRAQVEGSVRYESSKGELFLDSPTARLDELDVAGLPEKYRETAGKLIEKALQEYLARMPLYRLKSSDTKMLMVRRVLKSMRVRDGELLIELGF